jgi:hypothetical protein
VFLKVFLLESGNLELFGAQLLLKVLQSVVIELPSVLEEVDA